MVVIADLTRAWSAIYSSSDDLGAPEPQGHRATGAGLRGAGRARAGEPLRSTRRAASAPIVGRDQELALLLERWRQARPARARWSC